ncbi:MAG: DMT family transporter [Candidatus Bathyarchaeia archaeon]
MNGQILGLLAAICWASAATAYKLGLREMDLLTAVLVRSIFAAAFAIVAATFIQGFRWLGVLSYPVVVYAASSVILILAFGDLLYFAGLKRIGAARAVALSYSYPVFLLPISVLLLGETVSTLTVLGTLSVVSGVYFIGVSTKTEDVTLVGVWKAGILFSLAAAVSWAVGIGLYRMALDYVDALALSAGRMLFLIPFLTIARVVTNGRSHLSLGTKRAWALFAVGGILAVGVGDLMMLLGLSLTEAAVVAPFLAATPLFSSLLAVALLKERVRSVFLLGVLLVAIGFALLI